MTELVLVKVTELISLVALTFVLGFSCGVWFHAERILHILKRRSPPYSDEIMQRLRDH